MTISTGLGCAATPCTIEVPRRDDFVATFSRPGYADAQVPVTAAYGDRGRAIMVGAALGGGIGGVVGTEMSGTGYEHSPNPVVAELRPGRATPRPRRLAAPHPRRQAVSDGAPGS